MKAATHCQWQSSPAKECFKCSEQIVVSDELKSSEFVVSDPDTVSGHGEVGKWNEENEYTINGRKRKSGWAAGR